MKQLLPFCYDYDELCEVNLSRAIGVNVADYFVYGLFSVHGAVHFPEPLQELLLVDGPAVVLVDLLKLLGQKTPILLRNRVYSQVGLDYGEELGAELCCWRKYVEMLDACQHVLFDWNCGAGFSDPFVLERLLGRNTLEWVTLKQLLQKVSRIG